MGDYCFVYYHYCCCFSDADHIHGKKILTTARTEKEKCQSHKMFVFLEQRVSSLHTYMEVLFQSLPERGGNVVELNELPDGEHLVMVPSGARVEPADQGAHVAKDGGVHQGWKGQRHKATRLHDGKWNDRETR